MDGFFDNLYQPPAWWPTTLDVPSWVPDAYSKLTPEQLWVYSALPMAINIGFYWATAFAFFLADLTLHWRGDLARHKRQKRQVRHTTDWVKYTKTAVYVFLSQLLISVPTSVLVLPAWRWRGACHTCPLPSLPTLAWQVAVIFFCEEALFFYSHWMFHQKFFYKRFHKVHHEWIMPVGAAANYAHPVEHFLANVLPPISGPLLVGVHWNVVLVWFMVASVNVVKSHSGYNFDYLGSKEHDRHHESFVCEYGILGLFDWLHGTRYIDLIRAKVRARMDSSQEQRREAISSRAAR